MSIDNRIRPKEQWVDWSNSPLSDDGSARHIAIRDSADIAKAFREEVARQLADLQKEHARKNRAKQ